ncbi:MAG: hypothetical protein HDR04_09190 [Lachnospiraceae bacterium]|nr:hypothetical protein [Lachnospiraceae bacterium]
MSNDRIVLLDGTNITLESSQGMNALNVRAGSISAACALWEKFTPEKLKQVNVMNQDDVTVGKYTDMVLDHIEGRDNEDGSVQITFSLRSKTAEELLTERIIALETGQQAQDTMIEGMSEELTSAQMALTENYEMLEELSGTKA